MDQTSVQRRGLPPSDGLSGAKAEEVFDAAWYLEHHADVREAGVDPWWHYAEHGGREARDPAPWFDGFWYRENVLAPLGQRDADNPLEHWLAQGRPAGFSPSAEAERDLTERARAFFDEAFYLETQKDVARTGMDPWEHYLAFGWSEGRAPSEGFDVARYAQALRAAGDAGALRNPLLHWVAVGRDRERAAAGAAPEAARSAQAASSASLEALAEQLASERRALPEEDAALLAGSALFDPAHLAAQDRGYEGLGRAEAAERYLAEAPGAAPDPSALFSVSFYLSVHGAAVGRGTHALVHHLRSGRHAGLHPSPEAAWRDVLRLRMDHGARADLRASYAKGMRHSPRRGDVVEDYVLHGAAHGSRLLGETDDAFVRAIYARLVPGGIGAPAAFVARHASSGWVYPSEVQLRHDADGLRGRAVFDAAGYAARAGIAGTEVDPAMHYLTAGTCRGLPAGPGFDTARYLELYPDLLSAPIVPAIHFDDHGRAEGRVGHGDWRERPDLAGRAAVPGRPTVLLLTHEASRTGAPIVALNVARRLAETRDVITWTDVDGPLCEAFGEVSTRMLVGYGNPRDMEETLRGMQEAHGIEVAVVSSVVSAPALPALRLAGIPVVSLIHEFADYVFPAGKTSRMALYSDAAVFPADLVRQACAREMDALGLGRAPETMRIRPQGYNVADEQAPEGLDARDILALIDAPSDPARRRVLFGAGWVQPRKGVDLFLQVAAKLKDDPDHDWRFVWVGGNYRPDVDMVVSVYLAHQVREAGLASRMTFLPEQPSLEPFWEISDLFLMSSRLDPYPNVALEALYRAVPVVCFEGATGIADIAEGHPFAVRTAPFADAEAAAREVRALIAPQMRERLAGAPGDALREALSFEAYVDDLEAMVGPARERAERARARARAFDALHEDELALAAPHLPGRLRLTPVGREGVLARSLAETADLHGLGVDAGTGALEGAAGPARAAPGLLRWRAGGGMAAGAPGLGDPGEVEIVIHAAGDDGIEMARRLLAMLPSAPPPVRLVAGLPWLAPPLEELAARDGRARVEARAAQRLSEAGARRAAEEGPALVALLSAVPEPGAPQPVPAAPEGAVMAALLSGAAAAFLEAHPDCPAVLGPLGLGHRSAAADADEADGAGAVYAPRFCGVYRRGALASFGARIMGDLHDDAAGLPAPDWDSLAALRFARTFPGSAMLPVAEPV